MDEHGSGPYYVLSAEGLTKRFGDTVALERVSFKLRGPGLLGILGPNGAGKTTLLDILEGLSEPSEGRYQLFGRPPRPYPRRRVGVVMQNEARLERVTTREYAELFAAIYAVPDGTEQILGTSHLHHRADTPLARLSGGESARLFIATAMVHRPDLLFLDEPTAHLDPENKRNIGELLREMARERSVIMTTHDLTEADGLCDELLFLVDGRVRACGSHAELVGERSLEEAFFEYCAVHIGKGGEAAP